MVILGGLEFVAAGYLLHDYNKEKARHHTQQELQDWEKRQKREERRRREEYKRIHGHSPPPSQSLQPPNQHYPPRPSSAPPAAYPTSAQHKPNPSQWQPQQPYNHGQPSWQQGQPQLQPNPYPQPHQQHHYGPPPVMQQNYPPSNPQWQAPPPMPFYPAQNQNLRAASPYPPTADPDTKTPNLYTQPHGQSQPQYGSQQFAAPQSRPQQQAYVPSPRPGTYEMAGDMAHRRQAPSEVSSIVGEIPDPPPAYTAHRY